MAEAYSAFRITAAEERSDLGNTLRLHARADSLRPAVVHADETLSYGELERRTAALAWRLREHQAGPERVVAVHAKDRLSGLIAMVSVLRAGAVYLALEPGAPAARQKLVLEDSGAVLVLGDDESFDEPPTMRITGAGDDHGALLTPDAAHTAYLVYTSGTTGRPKPVAVPYGALHEHLSGLRTAFGLGPGDRVLHFAPPHVDVAIEQALAPLSAGATLVLTPGTSLPSIPDLVGLLHREQVTVANLPAGYLSELAGTLPRHPLPAGHSLRLMISGSDRMPSTAARAWLRHAPGVRLVNAYGPTESVITAATHEVTQAHGDIPIGAACGDRVLHVLDSSLSPCPAGEQGELYISGPLAHGYLGRPVPTARQFVPDPYGAPGARLYRTGDLARRREDGLLEFVGRIDDQLKIRGFRVEPAETRRVLEAHPDVRQCAVLGRRNGAGDTRLIGYVVSETGTGELMRFLTERLPRPLVPAHLIRMDRLPLTAGGTLDRDALPAAEQNPSRTEPPRTATEELLAGLWLETLGRDHIGRHDNFFALGGDSLTALRITARLLRYFGRDLTPQAVFETPVLADLAARLDAGQSAKPAGAAPRNGGDEGPLSLGQQALWLSEQWNPEAPIYNLPWLFRLSGPVDAALLERALNRLIERHEALRTVFPSRLGEPRQVVLPSVSVPVEKGEGLEEADVREPFDLDHGPLIRARLLRAVDGGPALLVVVHHLVWDEWSLGLFETELGELYQALSEDREPRLPALTARPIDYAADRREADHEQGLAYWRDRLADLPATAGEDRSPAGAVVRFALPPQLVARVRALARDAGATPFMVLLAAFAQMVQRRTGQDDLLVATPTADRDQAEWEGLIGYFVNLVPLRIKVSTDFRELLSRVREDVLTDLAHRDVPFPLIAEHVPRASGVALAFEMHRHRPCPLRLGEAEGSRELLPTGAAKFDMIWQITDDGERLFGVVEFSTDLYDTAEVETMVADWESGLTGAVQPLA
ncbi:amino acid adenylation domain-containing protein, partial [Nonomuraea sp. NPDC050540]|uniref:amino acid adenylation domain-containing protein n=1 Tax=Nonomuraea sp. NPDC050540 TaxID=3364367 RepID=UPI0037981776